MQWNAMQWMEEYVIVFGWHDIGRDKDYWGVSQSCEGPCKYVSVLNNGRMTVVHMVILGPVPVLLLLWLGLPLYIDKDFSVSQNFIVLMMIVVFIIVFVLKIGKYGMFLVVWKNWRNGTMVIRKRDRWVCVFNWRRKQYLYMQWLISGQMN